VKAIVYLYTTENIYSLLNLSIRDRDKDKQKNLGPFANLLKIIIDYVQKSKDQDINELVVFRGLKLS
jgi:hypothetical protein